MTYKLIKKRHIYSKLFFSKMLQLSLIILILFGEINIFSLQILFVITLFSYIISFIGYSRLREIVLNKSDLKINNHTFDFDENLKIQITYFFFFNIISVGRNNIRRIYFFKDFTKSGTKQIKQIFDSKFTASIVKELNLRVFDLVLPIIIVFLGGLALLIPDKCHVRDININTSKMSLTKDVFESYWLDLGEVLSENVRSENGDNTISLHTSVGVFNISESRIVENKLTYSKPFEVSDKFTAEFWFTPQKGLINKIKKLLILDSHKWFLYETSEAQFVYWYYNYESVMIILPKDRDALLTLRFNDVISTNTLKKLISSFHVE